MSIEKQPVKTKRKNKNPVLTTYEELRVKCYFLCGPKILALRASLTSYSQLQIQFFSLNSPFFAFIKATMEDIKNLIILGAIVKTLPTTYGGLAGNTQSMQIIEA